MTMLVVVALCACSGKKDQPPATAGSAAPEIVAGSAAADVNTGSAAADVATPTAEETLDVPTEVDFEELAATEITDTNIEARLKALETELAE